MRGNNPFGGFMMMPMPFGPQMAQEPALQPVPDIVVPARVNKALEFLNHLTVKTMTRAAVSENQIDQIDGQKLSEEESNAQATACNLLSQYFAGKLQPDCWEKLRVDAIKKQQEKGQQRGTILNCVMCGAARRPKKDCPLCEGSGIILVVGAQPDHPPGTPPISPNDMMPGDDI